MAWSAMRRAGGASSRRALPRRWRARCRAASAGGPEEDGQATFVEMFRTASPYIVGHHGRTFVVLLTGAVVADAVALERLAGDVVTLHALGVRVVLVVGAGTQIDELVALRGAGAGAAPQQQDGPITPAAASPLRATDATRLEAAMEAAGKNQVRLSALLTRLAPGALASRRRHAQQQQPCAGAGLHVAAGTFVSAKRRGVVRGVDFGHTGEVLRVDAASLRNRLDARNVVLLTNLGYSAQGEVLNCSCHDVAAQAALALGADKLVAVAANSGSQPSLPEDGGIVQWLPLSRAETLLGIRNGQPPPEDALDAIFRPGDGCGGSSGLAAPEDLAVSVYCCQHGVPRCHIVDATRDGALLLELYSPGGSGTMVSRDFYEGASPAEVRDLPAIERILRPLADAGVLRDRSRAELERDLPHFTVLRRDEEVVACGALLKYGGGGGVCAAEVAALTVTPACRGRGYGDTLLTFLEERALAEGVERLFLLTTRTADWFVQRGFVNVGPAAESDLLPAGKVVDPARGALLFVKEL